MGSNTLACPGSGSDTIERTVLVPLTWSIASRVVMYTLYIYTFSPMVHGWMHKPLHHPLVWSDFRSVDTTETLAFLHPFSIFFFHLLHTDLPHPD